MRRKNQIPKLAAMAFAGCLIFMQTGALAYAAEVDNHFGEQSGKVEILDDGIQVDASQPTLESVDLDGVPYYDYYYGVSEEKDEIVSSGLAISVQAQDGTVLVFVAYDVASGSDIDYHLLQTQSDSSVYYLEYYTGGEEADLMAFTLVDDGDSDTQFSEPVAAVQNQNVYAIYYTEDGDADYMEITLEDMDDSNLLTVSDMPDSAIYPLMLLDEENMDLVAVAFSKNTILALASDQDDFYANGSGSGSSGSSSSGDSDDDADTGTSDDNNAEETTATNTNTDAGTANEEAEEEEDDGSLTKLTKGLQENMVLVIVIVVVIGAAAVVIVLMVNKKQKQEKIAAESSPIEQTRYQPGPTPQPTPVQPTPQPAGSLKVYAIGGYMDGRVYTIDGNEISIGRDSSNTIIFPADTKGISRQHCKIFFQDGTLVLMDCGSSYGTFMEGYGKLAPYQPKPLQMGAVFYLADQKNSFVIK